MAVFKTVRIITKALGFFVFFSEFLLMFEVFLKTPVNVFSLKEEIMSNQTDVSHAV